MQNTSPLVRPKVLVLGNGILRAFEGAAGNCQDFEDLICDAAHVNRSSRVRGKTIPFPMRVAGSLAGLSNRHQILKQAIKDLKDGRYGHTPPGELLCNANVVKEPFFIELLNAGFSDIITTNYSYEIEQVLCGKCPQTGTEKSDFYRNYLAPKDVGITEQKFKLFKHYRSQDGKTRIWHVHGEYLKPQSIIFEYSDYCTLMSKVRKPRRDGAVNAILSEEMAAAPVSWLERFLDGDVYILGFGASFGEQLFWWLMERKKARNKLMETVCFYEPTFSDNDLKQDQKDRRELLMAFGAECKGKDTRIPEDSDFRNFYRWAAKDIICELKGGTAR